MKAISIRQPWAWLIVHGFKDIENRTWKTRVRGRVLVHTGKTFDRLGAAKVRLLYPEIKLPHRDELEFGGFIGSVEIVDCVTSSDSRWFYGPVGFTLADPIALPFVPSPGRLGFFAADFGGREGK